QAVMHVARLEREVERGAEIVQDVKQCHRIRAPGDGHQDAFPAFEQATAADGIGHTGGQRHRRCEWTPPVNPGAITGWRVLGWYMQMTPGDRGAAAPDGNPNRRRTARTGPRRMLDRGRWARSSGSCVAPGLETDPDLAVLEILLLPDG